MTVTISHDPTSSEPGQDTVLGRCTDFEHSPLEGGGRCRRSFLSCLDCSNARAFPEHLPVQLLVLDRLHAQRETMTAPEWAVDYAGPAAQLAEIIHEYEPAQHDHARALITDLQRRRVDALFAGDLEPT